MTLRVAIFLLTFLLMIGLESLRPRRELMTKSFKLKLNRWLQHLLFVGSGQLSIYLLLGAWGVSPVLAAEWASESSLFSWMLFPSLEQWLSIQVSPHLAFGLRLVIELLFLDLVIYFQHRLFHVVPFLWPFHRIHHSDPQLDASSALRFHPLELVISTLIKVGAVIFLGISVWGVLVFEILLSSLALFNHANFHIPAKVERFLAKWLITPDTHRVHHHKKGKGRFHNYGFNLTLWDFLFGTLMRVDEQTQVHTPLGLEEVACSAEPRFWQLWTLGLRHPFIKGRKDV